MGKHENRKPQSLQRQVHNRIFNMRAFGQSKHEAKKNGTAGNYIFSYETYNTTQQVARQYLEFLRERYPQIKDFFIAGRYVPDYLQDCVDRGLSPYTIRKYRSLLNKIFQITPEHPAYFPYEAPKNYQIKNNRLPSTGDCHFSETRNAELVNFVRGTGLRRHELLKLHGRDVMDREEVIRVRKNYRCSLLYLNRKDKALLDAMNDVELFPDAKYFIHIWSGKGGRPRIAPVIGEHAEAIMERMLACKPNEHVWKSIPSAANVHAYRADYAADLYLQLARDVDTLPSYKAANHCTYQKDVVTVRTQEGPRKLDKKALYPVSRALGHNRIDVVCRHYLYNLDKRKAVGSDNGCTETEDVSGLQS